MCKCISMCMQMGANDATLMHNTLPHPPSFAKQQQCLSHSNIRDNQPKIGYFRTAHGVPAEDTLAPETVAPYRGGGGGGFGFGEIWNGEIWCGQNLV